MIKKICVSMAIMFVFLSTTVNATTLEDEYIKQYELSGAGEIKEYLPKEVNDMLYTWGMDIENPNSSIDFKTILSSITEYISSTIFSPISTIGIILTILTLCALFYSLSTGDRQRELISYISAVIMCGGLISPILNLIVKTENAISLCCGFNLILLPIYSGILMASGSIKSLATGNIVFTFSQIIDIFISTFFPTFVGIFTSISICNSLNIFSALSSISSSFKKIVDWTLGIIVTLYTAILTITGIISSVSDTIGHKVGKFVVNSTIPVIGNILSDSFGTILGALKYLKSGVGLYVICAVIIILLPVFIEVLLWRYVLMISSSVAEMLGQMICANLLKSLSNGVALIFSILLSTIIIFIISLVVVIMGGGSI